MDSSGRVVKHHVGRGGPVVEMRADEHRGETPPIVLTHFERLAAIRAYNSQARDTLERGAMVDAIIKAINDERAGL